MIDRYLPRKNLQHAVVGWAKKALLSIRSPWIYSKKKPFRQIALFQSFQDFSYPLTRTRIGLAVDEKSDLLAIYTILLRFETEGGFRKIGELPYFDQLIETEATSANL